MYNKLPPSAKPPKHPPNLSLPVAALLLPHESDEHVGHVAQVPDPQLIQAKKDLDAGLVDTDMWATPGLDAARREALVPGAGGRTLRVKKEQ